MLQSFFFSNLRVSVLKRREKSPSSPGLGWSSLRQILFTQENLWICQAGEEKADFSLQKNIGQNDFLCASTPSGAVPTENIKTPFAELFGKKEGKKNAYKKNRKVLLQAKKEKEVLKWKFSLIPPTSETLEGYWCTGIFIISYFYPIWKFGFKKSVRSWRDWAPFLSQKFYILNKLYVQYTLNIYFSKTEACHHFHSKDISFFSAKKQLETTEVPGWKILPLSPQLIATAFPEGFLLFPKPGVTWSWLGLSECWVEAAVLVWWVWEWCLGISNSGLPWY